MRARPTGALPQPVRRLLPAAAACSLALAAGAQDYWTRDKIQAEFLADLAGRGPSGYHEETPAGSPDYVPNDPLAQLLQESQFLVSLQHDVPGPNFGGMEEGEILPNIIQTDNTTESIWVWSRYRQLTGDQQFDQNVADAWIYVMNHPAFLEELGPGPFGYYRIYNCGWALIAEPLYRQVTGDASFLPYAIQCADYVVNNPLSLASDFLNVQITAWAAGALYDFGVEQDNAAYRAAAVAYGDSVRQFAEANPFVLSSELWAMSGGAVLWGVLRSYFRENPGGRTWAKTFGPMTKTIDNSGTWRLAHTGWYALGRYEAWKASAGGGLFRTHREAYDFLVAADGDDDGGIPTTNPSETFADESWVSNYLVFMGSDKTVDGVDAAVADDVVQLTPGGTWDLSLGIGNHDALAQANPTALLEVLFEGGTPFPVIGPVPLVLIPSQVVAVSSFPIAVPPGVASGNYTARVTAFLPGPVLAQTAEVTALVP